LFQIAHKIFIIVIKLACSTSLSVSG